MTKAQWLEKPEEHDYPAAESFLSLIYSPEMVSGIITRLKLAPVVKFASKDVLRASGLLELDEENLHVQKDVKKIDKGEKLSPVLLVRDAVNGRVVIADGYHRVSAVHLLDECGPVMAKIV